MHPGQIQDSGDQRALTQNATGNAMTTITVFGGTGFLGRRLVQRLATEGAMCASRYGIPSGRGAPCRGDLNQVTFVQR